ncbi:alpha/beta hydrolase [Spongiibacter sp. KMU-166]|uniref:Alpha/beta hydrolase n=1 Tax=Spongiibacter thalassae TaxID=2721624 RepID=A0ABX1G9S5_9GAMM|nr:alpha/beta hydrolase fold domain-containing protein [Spongiibacter thalassae]NKI15910.1 alpha/beta hydrolase [Spongiibacter thalassae]
MKNNKPNKKNWLKAVSEKALRKLIFTSLPLPEGVSDEMRESLRKSPTMRATIHKLICKFMSISKLMERAEEMDRLKARSVEETAATLSVSIEQDSIDGVNVYWLTPETIDPQHENHLFINLHGGGYIMGAGMAGNDEAVLIAARAKMKVLAVDYRMAPDHPAPAGLNDVTAVWKYLLKSRSAGSMAMGGTSAGGGLTLGSIHKFKDMGLELPGAIYAGTPGGDCYKTGDSHYINEGVDRMLVSRHGILRRVSEEIYPGELGAEHCYVSPLRGDFENFPPGCLISGTRDALLSDTVMVHRKLRRAGVEADLHIYEGLSHADYMEVWDSPESREHYAELNAFLLKHLR